MAIPVLFAAAVLLALAIWGDDIHSLQRLPDFPQLVPWAHPPPTVFLSRLLRARVISIGPTLPSRMNWLKGSRYKVGFVRAAFSLTNNSRHPITDISGRVWTLVASRAGSPHADFRWRFPQLLPGESTRVDIALPNYEMSMFADQGTHIKLTGAKSGVLEARVKTCTLTIRTHWSIANA